jgi:hypothetical protein
LRLADYRRAERQAYDDDRLCDFAIAAGLLRPASVPFGTETDCQSDEGGAG